MSRSSQRTILALLVFTIVAGAAVVVADSTTNNDYVQAYDQDGNRVVMPKVRIINWDNTVAKFDSSTGAIYRFHGDLRTDDVHGQWVKSVPGITGASGALQIQNTVGVENFGATFLVDTVSGRTWILQRARRNRDNPSVGVWEEVKTLR